MGDGTEEKPYTSDDVLRLIKEHGGKAKGLDLSKRVFEHGIDLGGLDLEEIILRYAALWGAHLEEADLSRAHLERVELGDAHLEGTKLPKAHLEGARLPEAHLKGANLKEAHLEEALLLFAHLEGVDLKEAHLKEAWLQGAHLEGASLLGAHLEGAELQSANLEGASLLGANLEGANLRSANLKGAKLWGANLEGANLFEAHLERAWLWNVKFPPNTELENVGWGNYILGEEKEGYFGNAADAYRRLKQWHTTAGMYDIAAEFFFREMEARRKNLWKQGIQSKSFRKLLHGAWFKFLSGLCGYGERPLRVIASAVVVFFISVLGYHLATGSWTLNTIRDGFYYSAVSFTALGYGNWVEAPNCWVKWLGAIEAFAGVFMIALFLITFTRKMTR